MKSYNMLKNSWFLLGLLVLVCCSPKEEHARVEKDSRVATLPYYQDASFTPHWISQGSDSLKNFHQIPAFNMVNQEGDTITEKTFQDKIYVADFFFSICPGICPKMTANMEIVQEAFLEDDEVLLLSHSVMPEYDSVEVLQEYALNKGVNSAKWHLVTGDRQEIYNLGRYHYFVEEDLGLLKDPEEFLHTENFVLVDKNRRIRGIYNGLNKGSVNQLIADIKTLKAES
ncbi:MAG: SCO family protein [Bacteroidota bacterium]